MSDELLPCPFCGSQIEVKARQASANPSEGFIAFAACYCGGYSATAYRFGQGETEQKAIQDAAANWNCRATRPTQTEQPPIRLPERREPSADNPYLSDADVEWNAAVDEVARLNTIKSEITNG